MNYVFIAFDRIVEELGTGHVVRIERVLNAINSTKSNSVTTLITNNTNPSSADEVIIVSNIQTARKRILELIESNSVDVIIFDCLNHLNDLFQICKEKDIFTIGIDVSHPYSIDLDLSINPSIENKLSPLYGPAYAIHHEESKVSNISRAHHKKNSIFICFGGLDYQKHFLSISDHLKKIPHTWEINIVLSEKKDFIMKEKLSKNINLFFRPKNFFELLNKSTVSIISGGILLQESTYLGVPAFVIPQYYHQLELAKSYFKKGLCLGHSGLKPDYESIITKLKSLMSNHSHLNEISVRARASSDGFGLKRILNILEIFEYQAWDSEFFNKEIYSITCKTYTKSLKKIIQKKLLKNNIDLIYFLCPISNDQILNNALSDGFKKVDERLTYLVDANDFQEFEYPKDYLIEKSCNRDSKELEKLAGEIKWKTRYSNDKNFEKSKIKDFYCGWVLKSINGELDDEVFHVSHNGEIKGFVSIKKLGINLGSIGLIGVSPSSQGMGYGHVLTQFAVRYMIDEYNCAAVQVVTQLDNIGARKTYEKVGFMISDKSLWLHKWV